jgi:3-hydroxyacyl-[acyl-carrier-protein] dehydratase
MFQNEFYTIKQQQSTDGGFEATVAFNADHYIYKAHFPQNPITPGVMLIEICKELLMGFYQVQLTMTTAKNVKFLNVVNPLQHPEVVYKVSTSAEADGTIKANINIEKDQVIFAKISTVYTKA